MFEKIKITFPGDFKRGVLSIKLLVVMSMKVCGVYGNEVSGCVDGYEDGSLWCRRR